MWAYHLHMDLLVLVLFCLFFVFKQKCTGNVQSGKSFVEYLGDGTALCE